MDDESSSSSEEEEEEEEVSKKGKGKGKGQASNKQNGVVAVNKGNKKGEKKEKEEGGGKDVEVSFDFSDPDERFFFGIRSLLQWLVPEVSMAMRSLFGIRAD